MLRLKNFKMKARNLKPGKGIHKMEKQIQKMEKNKKEDTVQQATRMLPY